MSLCLDNIYLLVEIIPVIPVCQKPIKYTGLLEQNMENLFQDSLVSIYLHFII